MILMLGGMISSVQQSALKPICVALEFKRSDYNGKF